MIKDRKPHLVKKRHVIVEFPSHVTTLIFSTVAVDDNMLFNVKWSDILAKTWGNYLGQDSTI